jgi:hypothetical protein
MTKLPLALCTALLAAAAFGCAESGSAPAPTGSGAVGLVSAPTPASAAPEVAYADEDLPVPPDFEESVDKEIDDSNAADVLVELEKELDAGAPDAGPADAGAVDKADAGAGKADAKGAKAPPKGGKPPAPAGKAAGKSGDSEPY